MLADGKVFHVSQTMSAGLHHFLLMGAVSLSTIMAMPEPISEGSWEPPPGTIPALPHPPINGPGGFFYSDDNMTEPSVELLEAYCQTLLQASDPASQDQLPWFCFCTQCQSSPGPKGDRGDRGLPGEQHSKT